MMYLSRLIAAALLAVFCAPLDAQETGSEGGGPRWSIAIHGGAGTIRREDMSAEREAEYRAALQGALDAGAAILKNGGTALDAVEAVIVRLEDDPKFNAGKGAVYTWDEGHELDASIMDGATRAAGAVAGVSTVKSPIRLARKIMTDSPHVMLAGKGAEAFAAENGLEMVEPSYFDTPERLDALKRMKASDQSALDVDTKFGTVGAVALDQAGNLAAGTSTGGMTGKRWGRIGDAPIIGAGTYADNEACAVSATGWGEYFIRVGVAHEICTTMRLDREASGFYDAVMKEEAAGRGEAYTAPEPVSSWYVVRTADRVMADVKRLGGDGGVIVMSPEGHAVFSFNTMGMYRGRADSGGMNEVAIYGMD